MTVPILGGVRVSGARAADDAPDEQVERVTLAVVAQERVRQVHAAVGVQRDEHVLAVGDELALRGFSPSSSARPLGIVSIQTRPSSSWLTTRSKTSAE